VHDLPQPLAGTALTINPGQLDKSTITTWQGWEILPSKIAAARPLVNPYDESGSLDDRARSYLSINCGHCHRFGGGGAAKIILPFETALSEANIDGVRPTLGSFDLTDAYIVSGRDPSRSALLFRMSKLGQGRMPHIGSDAVDEAGVRLIRRWIAGLKETPCEAAAQSARAADKSALSRNDLGRLLSSTSGALDLLEALETMPAAARQEAIRKALELRRA
jgi:hypothetical protein